MDQAILKSIALFDGLSDDELAECAGVFQHREMLAGSSLVREDDFAYKFFVVLDGTVEIYRHFHFVAELGPGEFFGEMGLINGVKRNARVTAKTRCDVAWIMGWDFQTMSERFPVIAQRIQAVAEKRLAGISEPGSAAEDVYEPSTWDWVAEQVTAYESSGGTQANTLRESGIPIVVMTCRGAKTGKVRKVPVMRVEHGGQYAIVASKGGRPEHPGWYHNLVANPHVLVQDGPEPTDMMVHVAEGDERAAWWDRAVGVFPTYSEYEASATEHGRTIAVFIATPVP